MYLFCQISKWIRHRSRHSTILSFRSVPKYPDLFYFSLIVSLLAMHLSLPLTLFQSCSKPLDLPRLHFLQVSFILVIEELLTGILETFSYALITLWSDFISAFYMIHPFNISFWFFILCKTIADLITSYCFQYQLDLT